MRKSGMYWIIAIAFFGFWHWRARRAFEDAAERKATEMLRSPLHWASNALVLLLAALMLYIGYIHQQAPVPTVLLLAVLAVMGALLLLRRALKWRYPI
jgi:Flp pilus assembly protein TadB